MPHYVTCTNVGSNFSIKMIPRIITTILIGLLLSNCKSDFSREIKPDNVIETVKLNSDLFNEINLLTDSTVENGIFNKVVFKNGDKTVFEIYDEDAYDTIDISVLKGIKNEVESEYILIQNLGDKYFISLWGAEYGCCPRRLTVIQADNEGLRTIFKDEFEIDQIEKDDQGELKYFGIESFSEPLYPVDSLDILLFTYNPTLVYDLKSGFKLDSLLTKKYNEDNYVFAGFDYDGELKVAFPKNGEERKSGTRKPYIYR